MTQVIVDASLPAKLPTLKEPVDLCDTSGKVIGKFIPTTDGLGREAVSKFIPTVDMSEWEPITPDISDEELGRRAKSDKWLTFEEMMAKLKDPENK